MQTLLRSSRMQRHSMHLRSSRMQRHGMHFRTVRRGESSPESSLPDPTLTSARYEV